MPFAGIAFLWFIGVVRDQLGELEDRFFASVFLGSGLLFLAMVFVSMAVAGALLAGVSARSWRRLQPVTRSRSVAPPCSRSAMSMRCGWRRSS